MTEILICRGDALTESLPQAAKLPVQGKVDLAKNACIVLPKTDEVVLLEESVQNIDTAGGPTSSDPALRPAHLPRAYRPHRRGSADPFSLKTLHWRVFRALEPLKTVHWTVFRALDAPETLPLVAGEGLQTRLPAIPVPCSFGPAGPISLKTVHWTVFRALDAPEPLPMVAGEGFWIAPAAIRYSYCLLQQLDKSEFSLQDPNFTHSAKK